MNNGQEDDRDRYLYGDDVKPPQPTALLTGGKKFGSLKAMISVLSVAALVLFIVVIARVNSGYVIENTVINGESPYTEEEINALLETYFADRGSRSYFYLNVEELTERVMREMPYIKTLTIEKKSPDTLIFNVTGEAAEAYVEFLGSWYLLNSEMKVLARSDGEPSRSSLIKLDIDVPGEISVGSKIVFPENSRMDAETYARIYSALLSSDIRKRVQYIDVRNKFDLNMVLHGGVDVKVGSVKDIEEKLSTLSRWLGDNPEEIRSTLNIDISVLKKIYISYD